MRKHLLILTIFILCLSFVACTGAPDTGNIWENALYREDTELGKGDTTIFVNVTAEDKTVTLEINTNKETLGDALTEHKLISGEKGAYGLYVKFVNGIEADYDKDKSYWAIEKDGESLMTGVDSEKLKDNSYYEFIYTGN